MSLFPDITTLFAAGLPTALGLGRRRSTPLRPLATANGEGLDRLPEAILAIAARFAGLQVAEVDEAIGSALAEIGALLGVGRVQLFGSAADGQCLALTHEWCAPGVGARIRDLPVFLTEQFPWAWRLLESRGLAVVEEVAQLPAPALREREILARQGVTSFVCVAVHRQGRVVGFLSLDVFTGRRTWPSAEIGLLRVVADVLSSALSRKKAEEATHEVDRRFVSAFVNSPAPMLIVRGRDETATEANRAFLHAFGVTSEQVIGRKVSDLAMFRDPSKLDTVRAFLARNETLRDLEVSLNTATGVARHGLLSVDVFVVNGERYGLGVLSDLTEYDQAREELREREEIFRSISAAAQDAIVMMDAEGRVTVWNEAAERMFGYTREEATGQPVHDLIAPDRYQERSFLGRAQFHESGQGPLIGAPQQMAARRRDGTELPVELSISAVQLRGGWHAVAILRDITERLKVEEALWTAKEETEAANQELQRSVERANRLAEEAAAANATKSAFLANMSHEIRTPMNGVIGMSGLLLDTPLDAEQREYVDTVRTCADSLLTVINDILDFSKIEAGRLQLEVIDFDLAVAIEEMTEILAVTAREKNLALTCFIPPDVPRYLRGDPGRLRQVLTNLVGNAIKFTPSGEVAVSVRVDEVSADHAVLRFFVKDTGIGIPSDKLEVLFQPFTQVDSSTTRRFGGTGLGLSISRQLTQLMGGCIGVESQHGEGSTFWFTARFGRQAAAPPVPPLGEIGGVKVLAVDDNRANLRLVAKLLGGWGCRCETVVDAAEGLRALREAAGRGEPFQIALLDMLMPGMAGDELGRTIKQDPAIADTMLVMMTSVGRRGDVSRLNDLGFAGYLTKPTKGTQLQEMLRILMGRGAAERAGQAPSMVTRFTVSESGRRRARILLAEDNATNQRVARAMLEKMGHRVDAVANGAEAVRALGAIPYDLVLMDVQMPEMDGFEATRAIRKAGPAVRNPAVPIVAMTAHAMQGDRERCLAAGMDDYVAKPIRPDELAKAIIRWTSLDKGGQASRPQSTMSEAHTPLSGAADAASSKVVDGSAVGTAAAVPAPGQAVDREALLDRLGGDETILLEIVKIFLEDTPQLLASMESAEAAGDAKTLRRLAHSLKGSAGTVGATALQASALGLEQAVDGGDLQAAREMIPGVRAHFSVVQSVMSAWAPGGDAA